MSGRRETKVFSKKKKMKKIRKFLLTSKKCWLIEQSLLPLYQHLVGGYSEKLRQESKVKVEESRDYYILEFRPLQQRSSNDNDEVRYREINFFI